MRMSSLTKISPSSSCPMATSAAQLDSGGRGNTAGPVLSGRSYMFAEAVSPVVHGLSDEHRCAQQCQSQPASQPPGVSPTPPLPIASEAVAVLSGSQISSTSMAFSIWRVLCPQPSSPQPRRRLQRPWTRASRARCGAGTRPWSRWCSTRRAGRL